MAEYRFEDIAINSTEKKKPVESDKEHYLGLEHLDSGTFKVSRFGSEVAPIGDKLIMKKGDVLFGKRRAYQKKVAIAPFDGIFSAHGMVLRPKEDVIDKNFFPLFIASDYFLDAAIKISVGSLSPTINWRDLKELKFNLPELDEQKKLAEVLWQIVDTMESYKKLMAKTDEMVKAKFVEMFGTLIDENKYATIEKLTSYFGDGDWIESKDQSEKGIRLVQTGNIGLGKYLDKEDKPHYITEDTYRKLNCTEIFPNDILVSRLPDPVGRACVIPDFVGKAITAVDCTIIRFSEKILPEFFIAFTLTKNYQNQIDSCITGSTRKRISRSNLGQIKVPLPSVEEQKNFVELYKQSEKSKAAIQASLDSLSAVYKKIIAENLGGK